MVTSLEDLAEDELDCPKLFIIRREPRKTDVVSTKRRFRIIFLCAFDGSEAKCGNDSKHNGFLLELPSERFKKFVKQYAPAIKLSLFLLTTVVSLQKVVTGVGVDDIGLSNLIDLDCLNDFGIDLPSGDLGGLKLSAADLGDLPPDVRAGTAAVGAAISDAAKVGASAAGSATSALPAEGGGGGDGGDDDDVDDVLESIETAQSQVEATEHSIGDSEEFEEALDDPEVRERFKEASGLAYRTILKQLEQTDAHWRVNLGMQKQRDVEGRTAFIRPENMERWVRQNLAICLWYSCWPRAPTSPPLSALVNSASAVPFYCHVTQKYSTKETRRKWVEDKGTRRKWAEEHPGSAGSGAAATTTGPGAKQNASVEKLPPPPPKLSQLPPAKSDSALRFIRKAAARATGKSHAFSKRSQSVPPAASSPLGVERGAVVSFTGPFDDEGTQG